MTKEELIQRLRKISEEEKQKLLYWLNFEWDEESLG
jgi:hypothetical protein